MAKKDIKTKKEKEFVPLPEVPEDEVENSSFETPQSLNQKKIALANSSFGPIIIELMKDIMQKVPIVGKDEWETVKNAIIIDTSSTMLRDMVDYLEEIKRGSLAGKK